MPQGYAPVTVYASGRTRRRGLVLACLVVAAAAAAGGLSVFLSTVGGSAHTLPARHATPAAARKDVDVSAVPVAVLNATSTPGAASQLARRLRSDGIGIGAVGNLAESRPPGLWILYTPGERNQAARLAHLLRAQAPTIAPIDPVAQAAAGSATALAVVIT